MLAALCPWVFVIYDMCFDLEMVLLFILLDIFILWVISGLEDRCGSESSAEFSL